MAWQNGTQLEACEASCCTFTYSGPEPRATSMMHGQLRGWLCGYCVHELYRRARFWMCNREVLKPGLVHLPVLLLLYSMVYAAGIALYFGVNDLHFLCARPVDVYYTAFGFVSMPLSGVWASMLNLRVACLFGTARDRAGLKPHVKQRYRCIERALLVLSVVSPLVYLIQGAVLFATVQESIAWLCYSVQFAAECLVATVLLLFILPDLVSTARLTQCTLHCIQCTHLTGVVAPCVW
jgi:hypothetical protein